MSEMAASAAENIPDVSVDQLMAAVNMSDTDSGCALDEYSWIPPGLTARQVQDYMCSLPAHCVPYSNSQYRTCQLLRQLPPHDAHARYCHGLSDEEKKELKFFNAQRMQNNFGRGVVQQLTSSNCCAQCGQMIPLGEIAVMAPRVANTQWHPSCFLCCVCNELLVDLVYFYGSDGRVYCGRHHAETLKPRCVACDEIIFSEECTEAEGNSYHTKHFVCANCNIPLGGERYIMNGGRPYCCDCYESLFAAVCSTCGNTIGVNEGHMVHGAHRWHATDVCYRCQSCDKSLLGRSFVMTPSDEKLYCVECGMGDLDYVAVKDNDARHFSNSFHANFTAKLDMPSETGREHDKLDHLKFIDDDVLTDFIVDVDTDKSSGLAAELVEHDQGKVAVESNELLKPRKSKNVRFDPSTKDTRSPEFRDSYRRRRRSHERTRNSKRDWDDSWRPHSCRHHDVQDGGHCVECTDSSDGTLTRTHHCGHGSSNGNDDDDCEKCSTCSSSSSDSEFDYSAYFPASENKSQTLPSSWRHSNRKPKGATSNNAGQINGTHRRRHKHKSKNCLVS